MSLNFNILGLLGPALTLATEIYAQLGNLLAGGTVTLPAIRTYFGKTHVEIGPIPVKLLDIAPTGHKNADGTDKAGGGAGDGQG